MLTLNTSHWNTGLDVQYYIMGILTGLQSALPTTDEMMHLDLRKVFNFLRE